MWMMQLGSSLSVISRRRSFRVLRDQSRELSWVDPPNDKAEHCHRNGWQHFLISFSTWHHPQTTPLVKHLQNVNYQRKNIRSERRRNLLTHKKSTQTRRALAPSLNSFFTRKFSHENDKYFNYDASTKKLFIFVAFNHFDLSSFARTQRDQRLLMFSSPEFLRLRRLRPKVWSVSISKKSFMFRLSGDHFQERLIRNLIAMNFLYNSRKSSALISWDLFWIVERLKTVFWDV